jgi:carbon storage regulator CsrA
MLALTRRVGEEIVIGDPKNPLGTIRVVDIRGDKVRLSFDFHTDTQINRKELADEKARQPSPSAPHQAPSHPPQATAPNPPATDSNPAKPQDSDEPNGNLKSRPAK